MLGNEASARGALEAGVGVATSYLGTPATEILKYLVEHGKSFGVRTLSYCSPKTSCVALDRMIPTPPVVEQRRLLRSLSRL